jgi:hypothetical protein
VGARPREWAGGRSKGGSVEMSVAKTCQSFFPSLRNEVWLAVRFWRALLNQPKIHFSPHPPLMIHLNPALSLSLTTACRLCMHKLFYLRLKLEQDQWCLLLVRIFQSVGGCVWWVWRLFCDGVAEKERGRGGLPLLIKPLQCSVHNTAYNHYTHTSRQKSFSLNFVHN